MADCVQAEGGDHSDREGAHGPPAAHGPDGLVVREPGPVEGLHHRGTGRSDCPSSPLIVSVGLHKTRFILAS